MNNGDEKAQWSFDIVYRDGERIGFVMEHTPLFRMTDNDLTVIFEHPATKRIVTITINTANIASVTAIYPPGDQEPEVLAMLEKAKHQAENYNKNREK